MGKTTITSIQAHEVYSDRMQAAVQVTVLTENGGMGQAICTAGISAGTHEAPFLYDGDRRFRGCGVQRAAEGINQRVAPRLLGRQADNQADCDAVLLELGKEQLGANATAAVSSAVLQAGANALGIPLYEHIGGVRGFTLPVPGGTAVSGSTRYGCNPSAGYKPTYSFVAYGFDTFTEASTALWEVFMGWSDYMKDHMGIRMQPIAGMAIPQGKLADDYLLWEMLSDCITRCGMQDRVGLQADIAANCFYNRETKLYEGIFCPEPKTREDMIKLAVRMARDYPFVILEDPLMEDDFEGFAQITQQVDIQITADDLTAMQPDRVAKAIAMGAGNALRITTGQIGTVTEAASIVQTATENRFGVSLCGERGEGVAACDYAVGYNAGTAREYGMGYSGNRLLAIEEELGQRARFFGGRGIRGSRFQLR